MYSRRTFLKISGILATLLASGYIFRNPSNIRVKHILPAVSHEKIAVSLSLSEGASKLELILDDKSVVKGKSSDREGKHWQFIVDQLSADNSYNCLLYTSPSPRDRTRSRMPSSA